jgi:hypothetical protein
VRHARVVPLLPSGGIDVMTERRFNENEVALILRKATETSAPAVPGGAVDGLTLEDLKGIGREVGIDPGAIEAAARHVAVTRLQGTGGFFGVSATPSYETTLPGEIPPERLAEAVAAVRRAMGRQGVLHAEFGGLEWQARDALGGRYVSLQPSGGRTRIRVFGNFRDGAFLSAALGGLPVGFGSVALVGVTLKALGLSAVLGVGTLPAGIVAGVAAARMLWRRLARRETRALERTAAELEWALAGGAGPGDPDPDQRARNEDDPQ